MGYNYNPSESGLPKWAQAELDKLRTENINLRAATTASLVSHVIRLDQDWFVMPGPSADQPAVRLWVLGSEGPKLLATLGNGQSLAFQQVKEESA
jgi:hypothetical protein